MRRIVSLALVALALSGCGGGNGSGGEEGGGASPCKVGDTVDTPAKSDGVPACAEQNASTLTYGCYPKPGGDRDGSFYVVQVGDSGHPVLYGKPGGKWVEAASADKLDENLVKSIGC